MKMKHISIWFFLLVVLLTACTTQIEQQSIQENNQKDTEINKKENKQPKESTIQLPEPPLQKNSEGESVNILEEALQELGYSLSVSGVYDEEMTWAITDFQLQTPELLASGIYDQPTKEAMERVSDGGEVTPSAGLAPLTDPEITEAGSEIIGNPYDVLAVVNKQHALPADYVPDDLTVPEVAFPFEEEHPRKQLRSQAATALEALFAAAKTAGHELYAQSGYRSYERQVNLFSAYAEAHGEEAANQFSARAGESEHQTGLAMDISSPSVNYELTTAFGETPEGQWVHDNASTFGFIIRYPEGKEEITEYQYEPWHLRYVGKEVATLIAESNLTMEEYFEVK